MDTVNQLLLGGNANSAEHGSRHLAEHGFDDVEPGAVFRREDELEALRMKSEIRFRLLGDVNGMIVEKQSNAGLGRVLSINLTEQGAEIDTGMLPLS